MAAAANQQKVSLVERQSLKASTTVLVLLFGCEPISAAITTLDMTVPVNSGVLSVSGSPFYDLAFSKSTSEFTVNDGDGVHARLMFDGAASFQLLGDAGGLGSQGRLLLLDPLTTPFRVEFGFSFGLLDSSGNLIVSNAAGRVVRPGGDVPGDVTLPTVTSTLDVGGFFFEFNDIRNAFEGGLPVAFNGVRFDLTDVIVASPLFPSQSDGNGTVPEPASLVIWGGIGLAGLWACARRCGKRA